MNQSLLPALLEKHEDALLVDWMKEQSAPGAIRDNMLQVDELRRHCQEFLRLLTTATKTRNGNDTSGQAFSPVKELLGRISSSRSEQGFTPAETAIFVFSLKRPLFARLRAELDAEPAALFDEIWAVTELLDQLGLYTTEVYQRSREAVIARQQSEMLELSTPVVKLWDGILALPLIGTLDSNRTQIVMETLLERIVETNSEVAIIDITGVPTVDTLVAQHLLKTVSAARLMGVDCIISGVRPQIAQTIVHLGVSLGEIPTKSTLAAAFKMALRRIGASVEVRRGERETNTADATRNNRSE
ncbi:MAG TPA: STAS domain-containing protein [Polyangiaceae bacterium]